jgi:polysaccharide export outer membrane protein
MTFDPQLRGRPTWTSALVGALLLGLVSACASPTPPPTAPPMESYRVGPPDELAITILPEPVIERDVVVRPDGMISVDLIGDIPAAGRTPQEIAADIQTRIGRFKRDASVTVAVGAALSTEITVLGEVRRPSTFPLARQTRLIEAIGTVGGTTPLAAKNRIKVVRFDEGRTHVYVIDLGKIREGDLSRNVLLQGGDLVYVPPTRMAAVGYALQSVLYPFQQLFGFGAQISNTVFF